MKKTTSWGNVAKWYDSLLEGNDDTYQSKVILPNLIRNLSLKKGERVLDIACGQGFFSRELYKQGAEVSGVDISKKLIKIAEKNSPRQIYFHSTNVSTMPMFENNYFDKVVCKSVLYTFTRDEQRRILKEFYRILKPGGKIVISNPSKNWHPVPLFIEGIKKNFQKEGIIRTIGKLIWLLIPAIKVLKYNLQIKKKLTFHVLDTTEQELFLRKSGFVNIKNKGLVYSGYGALYVAEK